MNLHIEWGENDEHILWSTCVCAEKKMDTFSLHKKQKSIISFWQEFEQECERNVNDLHKRTRCKSVENCARWRLRPTVCEITSIRSQVCWYVNLFLKWQCLITFDSFSVIIFQICWKIGFLIVHLIWFPVQITHIKRKNLIKSHKQTIILINYYKINSSHWQED